MCCMIPDSAVHIHHEEPVPTAELEEIQKKTVLYVDSLAETGLGNNNHNGNELLKSLVVETFEDMKHADGPTADTVLL